MNAMIECIKQTAVEVRHTYGKRSMRVALNSQGDNMGVWFFLVLQRGIIILFISSIYV